MAKFASINYKVLSVEISPATAETFAYVETGQKVGNVLIRVGGVKETAALHLLAASEAPVALSHLFRYNV